MSWLDQFFDFGATGPQGPQGEAGASHGWVVTAVQSGSTYSASSGQFVPVSTLANAVTVSLPLAASAGNGGQVLVFHSVGGSHACTVALQSGDSLVVGPTTVTVATGVIYVSDGSTSWYGMAT